MAHQQGPVSEVADGVITAVLKRLEHWATLSWRFVRRRPLKPFSVSAFSSASFHYSSPQQLPSLFSGFVPRRGKDGQDLVRRVTALLDSKGKVLLVGAGGLGKSTLAYQARRHWRT